MLHIDFLSLLRIKDLGTFLFFSEEEGNKGKLSYYPGYVSVM